MENVTYLTRGSPYIQESVVNATTDVRGNLELAPGFLLGYVVLGVVSFMWAFWSQRHRLGTFKESVILSFTGQHDKLRGVQNMHSSLIPLLFIDVVTAITAIVLAVEFNEPLFKHRVIVFYLWSISRSCELVLHFVNALVCILFLYDPELGIKRLWIAPVMVLFIAVGFIVFRQIAVLLPGCINLTLTLSIIMKCTGTPPSPSAATRRKQIAFIAIFTFLLTSAPVWVLQFCLFTSAGSGVLHYAYNRVYMNVLFGTNFNLFMDGLLCFFILKLPSIEEEQQEQEQQQNSLENPRSFLPSFHYATAP